MENGKIIIKPFKEKNLKTTSYDVALGSWYWSESTPESWPAVHNIYDENSTKVVWLGPYEAEPVEKTEERLGQKFNNIEKGASVILLEPGETILAHTEEFVGGRDVCVAKMYARSSLGRNFIEVCKDAGWGDVGYFNRWTMEITNNSRNFSIPLVVGRRIAQMVFYEVSPITSDKLDYAKEKGKYQTSSELEELEKSWNPQMMIPKMHLDWEAQKHDSQNT